MSRGEKVWILDENQVEGDVLAGKGYEEAGTCFGENELVVDLLRETGLWEQLMTLKPKVRPNGVPWQRLNGILILKELLHVGKLQHIGKVIRDGHLMHELGFNLAVAEEKREEDRGVIHRDTARNHLKRVGAQESVGHFYQFVRFMREKRWIRGGVYAADGFEIEVYGKSYPKGGEVWDEREKRWKRGYKVVLLMNIQEERERVVGFTIGPIQTDERKLLREILEQLEEKVGKVHEMIDTLVLDRGYFGWDFFEELKGRWKVHFILMAKQNLLLTEEVAHLSGSGQVKMERRYLDGEEVEVGAAHEVMHGYKNKEQPYQGKLNVAILRKQEKNRKGKEASKEYYYVTDQGIRNPLKIIELYRKRWTIENQGIRELSQTWKIREMAGRTWNAILARLVLVLELYNAIKIVEMKYPKDIEELKKQLKRRGERSLLSGDAVVVYCGKYFATLSRRQYTRLVRRSTQFADARALQAILKKPKHLQQRALERLTDALLE